MSQKCLVVIVTYNSQKHIQWVLDGLESSQNDIVVRIIDSGSTNSDYLDAIQSKHRLDVVKTNNVGFVAGNNQAMFDAASYDWVLLLNPDAHIEGTNLDRLLSFAATKEQEKVGLFSVPLIRFNIDEKKPLPIFDSVGIACSPVGRWYDIDANQPVSALDKQPTAVDAVCGAFMLLRVPALLQCCDKQGKVGFESSYYMYKEDIELSLRLKRQGWGVSVYNDVTAYHCRGWNGERKDVPYWARWHSAINDVDVAWRYKWRALPYALTKLAWVKFVEKK